jgi:hypothetical protein
MVIMRLRELAVAMLLAAGLTAPDFAQTHKAKKVKTSHPTNSHKAKKPNTGKSQKFKPPKHQNHTMGKTKAEAPKVTKHKAPKGNSR